jgi:hypothetical protein
MQTYNIMKKNCNRQRIPFKETGNWLINCWEI